MWPNNIWILFKKTTTRNQLCADGDTSLSSLQSGNKGLPVQCPAFAQCDTNRSPCPDRPPKAKVGVVVAAAAHPRPCWLVGPLWTVLTDFDGGNSFFAGLKLSQRPCECSRYPEVIRLSQAPEEFEKPDGPRAVAFSNQARLSNPSDGRPSLRSVDDSTIHIEPGQPNSKGFLGVSWTGRCDAVEANQVFYF